MAIMNKNTFAKQVSDLKNMRLHEAKTYQGFGIMRVATGWIYENEKGFSVFVPEKLTVHDKEAK